MKSKKQKSKGIIRRSQDQTSSAEIHRLPYEIIFNILSQLPVKSVLQCRRVCKSWLTILSDPQFASAHFARSVGTDPSIILCSRNTKIPTELYFVDIDTLKISTWIPKFCGNRRIPRYKLIGSCNGLICLSDFVSEFVCNPLTMQYMELPAPTLRRSLRRRMVGFGVASNSKEYKVVRMLDEYVAGVSRLHVEVFTLGTGYWRSKGTIPYRLLWHYHLNTLVNGALHWISLDTLHHNHTVIVSFEVEDEEFRVIPNPELDSGIQIISVGVTEGCLSIHSCSQNYLDVWVMKDYGVKESWSKYFVFPKYPQYFPLIVRRNGELLLHDFSGRLLTYNEGSRRFMDLQLYGVSKFNLAYLHVASLIRLDSVSGGKMSRRKIEGKMMRVMDPSFDLKKNKRARAFWTKEMDDITVDVLIEEIQKGRKGDYDFHRDAYTFVVYALKEKLGVDISWDDVVSRMRSWENQVAGVRKLLGFSGFDWDPKNNRVIASKEVWAEYLKANPSMDHYQNKTIDRYEELCKIVGDDTATNEFA